MKYDLKKPCGNCPFKTKTMPYISTERAESISLGIMNGGTFACHKTTQGDAVVEQHCGGAMIFLEKQNNPNQMMRIAERFRDYSPKQLDMEVSVYDSPEDMVHTIGVWNGDIDE